MPGKSLNKESDKRRSPRKALVKQGVLDYGDGKGEHQCIILDISDSGAKVALEFSATAPEIFDLRLISGESFNCRLVWQHDYAMGVEFIEVQERANPSDEELRQDRRMAVMRRGRIIFNGGFGTMDCVILDMGGGGARIRPADPVSCPEVFQLSIEFGPTRACKILRSEGEDIAVQFLDRPEER
jgi:hypothetical protein